MSDREETMPKKNNEDNNVMKIINKFLVIVDKGVDKVVKDQRLFYLIVTFVLCFLAYVLWLFREPVSASGYISIFYVIVFVSITIVVLTFLIVCVRTPGRTGTQSTDEDLPLDPPEREHLQTTWGTEIIYPRSQNLNFSTMLAQEYKESDILGITLRTPLLPFVKSDLKRSILNKGCRYRILMCHPKSVYLQHRMNEEADYAMGQNINTVVDLIHEERRLLPYDKRQNLDLRFYDDPLYCFLLRRDKDIHWHAYSYREDAGQALVVHTDCDHQFGKNCCRIFQNLWDNSETSLLRNEKKWVISLREWIKKNFSSEYKVMLNVEKQCDNISRALVKRPASLILRLAALAHDIDRAIEKKSDYQSSLDPRSSDFENQYKEYKKKHQADSSRYFRETIQDWDIPNDIVDQVCFIIENHDVSSKKNDEIIILQAADSMIFYQEELEAYRRARGEEWAKRKCAFMWRFSQEILKYYPHFHDFKKLF